MVWSRRKKRVALGFTAVGLFIIFIFLASTRFVAVQKEKRRFEAERAELKAPEPVARAVEARELVRMRRYAVEILPWVEANVPAEVAGRVIETNAEAGQVVKKGEVLVRLDEKRARLAVDVAKARHEEAMRLLGEAERLQKSNVVSKTAYEAALSEARVTKAQLNESQDLLEKHVVVAPFDGVVNERLVDLGDAVNVNEPVAVVVELDRLRVRLDVAESDLAAFPVGQPLLVRTVADGANHSATVRFRSRSADAGTKLFRIEAELENADLSLPGRIQGVVEAPVRLFAEGPVVPAAAVRFAGRDALVLKDVGLEDPEFTKITIGPEVDGVFPVFEGLEVGDRIFVR